jgi:hypothetical protein
MANPVIKTRTSQNIVLSLIMVGSGSAPRNRLATAVPPFAPPHAAALPERGGCARFPQDQA